MSKKELLAETLAGVGTLLVITGLFGAPLQLPVAGFVCILAGGCLNDAAV